MEGEYLGYEGNARKLRIKIAIAQPVWAPNSTENWVATSAIASSPTEVFDQWIGYALVLYVSICRVEH